MPLSKTRSTSKKGWNKIYEKIIKPAVENSDFNFTCKRSTATRGNIVKDIVNDLNESDIVIADLTDHNANVCYELGIRHGLNNGTILLAQKREFLKIFDLNNYASHVYSWKSDRGRKEMTKTIRKLLHDFLKNPSEPDNPVKDFLQHKPSYASASSKELKSVVELDEDNVPYLVVKPNQITAKQAVGFILLGAGKEGLTFDKIYEQLRKSWKRKTKQHIHAVISKMKGEVISRKEEGKIKYRLSGTGRSEYLKIVNLLKKD